ncbi:9112_t:CDS:2, partial [Scutellospora calospora]
SPEVIITNETWPDQTGILKTNTVLQYDADLQKVELWGSPALAQRYRRRRNNNSKPVELFKLHLMDTLEDQMPTLPEGLDYRKAITDYLCKLGEVSTLVKSTIDIRWPQIDFFKNVLLILTVPVEYSEKKKAIMKQCAFDAGLIKSTITTNLKITTEPSFLIVDIGGGTVDLTVRKLLVNSKLGEITEQTGECCGGSFVDKEFIKFVTRKIGESPMYLLKEFHYGIVQYMVQEFSRSTKIPFT